MKYIFMAWVIVFTAGSCTLQDSHPSRHPDPVRVQVWSDGTKVGEWIANSPVFSDGQHRTDFTEWKTNRKMNTNMDVLVIPIPRSEIEQLER